MDSYTDSHPFSQRRPLGSFSGISVRPCSSEGSQIRGLGSSKSPDAHVSFQPPMAGAEVFNQGTSGGSCGFRRLAVDDCARIRLFLMADEHFLLQRDPADLSPVYCIICQENFGDARNMLRHLRNCKAFDKGGYLCPTCNTWEQVRISSKKKSSRLRTRLGNKIRKGYEEALKRLLGPKQTLCSKCRCEIEAAGRSFSNRTTNSSWASLGEKGSTAPYFSASSTQQYNNKSQPTQRYPMPPPPFELETTRLRGELYDTSPLSELRDANLKAAEIYPYAVEGPQALGFDISEGIPEIDSLAVGFGAFPGRTNEQTFPMSSNPPYASARTSSLAPYDTSPTEMSSVAPTHTSHTAISVSPTSTESSGGVSSCQAHLSPEKSFSTNPDNFATESLHGMPTTFTSRPVVSMGSFQETPWNPVVADMRPSPSLAIDTSFMNTYAPSSTWGPQHSYLATPTMASFQNPPVRAVSNPFSRALRSHTGVNENGSPVSAQSSSTTSPSSLQSPSPSPATATATASPTSDASGPASMDEASAGPLQCPDCDFRPSGKNTASYPAYLRKHVKCHEPCRIKCGHCEATFSRPDNLRTHVLTVHGGRRKRAASNGMSPPDLRRKKTRGPEAGEP